jgi:hypothetical protein
VPGAGTNGGGIADDDEPTGPDGLNIGTVGTCSLLCSGLDSGLSLCSLLSVLCLLLTCGLLY